MIVDEAEVNVVAPVERVSPEIRMPEIGLPGVVISPVKHLGVTVISHVIVETHGLIVAVAQVGLIARVRVKVIHPFDPDSDIHVDTPCKFLSGAIHGVDDAPSCILRSGTTQRERFRNEYARVAS